ncbi:hypothetical protein VP01_2905g6 [Puccinia sorghi]|uniref:Uncharacterized protein n=1 Tax=Puccinia sorghi TaxID=27349 RepID=A0A0L6V3A7_9BASI|nr:hypothetical protein VP01_2905g6 [Puccinia sorghi]
MAVLKSYGKTLNRVLLWVSPPGSLVTLEDSPGLLGYYCSRPGVTNSMPRRPINSYAKYLAVDLRSQGVNINEIKRIVRINFSNSSLHRWTKLLQCTSSVVRNPNEYNQFGASVSIPPGIQEKLRKYLNENPTTYLARTKEWLLKEHDILTCISTINQILCNVMKISLKKNHLVNSKQSNSMMTEYLSQVGTMLAEFMMNRQYVSAASSECQYPLLPGIYLYGVLGLDIKEGSFKWPNFESFLKHTLVSIPVHWVVLCKGVYYPQRTRSITFTRPLLLSWMRIYAIASTKVVVISSKQNHCRS